MGEQVQWDVEADVVVLGSGGAALIAALETGAIGGAALDVFDIEPLPQDHPFRRLERAQISPHLGYVTEENYRQNYPQVVEAIRAFIDGAPVRVMG